MTLLLSRDKIVIMKTPKELEYARKKGLVFYNTGKPCPNGHKARRYTKSSKCVECVRLRAKVYGKVYFQKNKVRLRKIRRKHAKKIEKSMSNIKGNIENEIQNLTKKQF